MPSAWTTLTAEDGGSNFDWTAPRVGFEFESSMRLMTEILNDRGKTVGMSFGSPQPRFETFRQWVGITTNTRSLLREFIDISVMPADPNAVTSYTEVIDYHGRYIFKPTASLNYSVEEFWQNLETITGEYLIGENRGLIHGLLNQGKF